MGLYLGAVLTVICLVPSISGLLTDPGPLCPGEMVTLTCNITGGFAQQWRYNTMNVGDRIIPLADQVPAVPMMVDGVEFTLSLLSTGEDPYLATQIAFASSERMDGRMVECRNDILDSSPITETVTIQYESRGLPSDVRLSNSLLPIHGIGQSDVIIEWTPPPNGGNDVMYTIGITPAPLSGAMSVTTSSTQTTITVRHNTIYTVTVGVNTTCTGVQEATGTISIAGCPNPLFPMDGSIIPFPATNEGAEIVYHCDPGFQPQSNETAMCASNGLWTPDPAQHQCIAIADCGVPAIPSNASLMDGVFSTTEGTIVTFQCEEGLIPSLPIVSICAGNGQWTPDLASIQCISEVSESSTVGDMDSTSPTGSTIPAVSSSKGPNSTVVAVICSVLLFFVGSVRFWL